MLHGLRAGHPNLEFDIPPACSFGQTALPWKDHVMWSLSIANPQIGFPTSLPAITGIDHCYRPGAMEPLSTVSSMGYQPNVVGPGWIGAEGTMALSFSRDFCLNHFNLVQKLLKIVRIQINLKNINSIQLFKFKHIL
jgi:hypothetical protein